MIVAASIVDDLAAQARDLPPSAVAGIGAVAAFLVVLAVGVHVSVRRLRAQLDAAEEELVDQRTGLLPRAALRVRLGAELAWAATSRTPVAVAVLRIRGSRFPHAARVLRHGMREEESAFLLGEQRVVAELWDTGPEEAAVAARRLGAELAAAGHPVVDVGVACSPRDGADVETLVAAAQRDLRPVDDPSDPGSDVGGDGAARAATAQALALLAWVVPWFAAMGLVLLATWRLLPAAIDPVVRDGGNGIGGTDLAYALIAAIGVPLGAALVHASCWNRGGGAAPTSRPFGRAGVRATLAVALLVGVPLAWGVLAPQQPSGAHAAEGAVLAVLVLVVLVLLHARQLVHAVPAVLVVLALLGATITWLAVDAWSWPIVANAGRVLLAAAAGALLASLVERASWIVVLALIAGAVDAWSVWSDSGVTNRVLDSAASGEGDRLLDLLLFTGPVVGGAPLFELGVTDLVFLALFLAWSHDWRVDMRVAVGAMVVASWTAIGASEVTGEAVPMLPFLAGAMVLVVAHRSLRLRRRVRAHARAGSLPA